MRERFASLQGPCPAWWRDWLAPVQKRPRPRSERSPKCCVCHKKCSPFSENAAKALCLPPKKDRCVVRHVRMSRSATPATICRLSPLDAALTMRLAKNTQHHVYVVPATRKDDRGLQIAAHATKSAIHFLKTPQKHCACHIKTIFDTLCWNVTKCNACQAKRCYAILPRLQISPYRHCHRALMRTFADGCERLRTVGNGDSHLITEL